MSQFAGLIFVDIPNYCIYSNSVTYEWDESKRIVNLKRHGLDFVDAPLVYEQPDKLTVDSPRSGEGRKMDISTVRGLVLTLVYTERPGAARIISFRRSSRRERRQHDEYQRIG